MSLKATAPAQPHNTRECLDVWRRPRIGGELKFYQNDEFVERELLSPKIDVKSYIRARVMEVIDELSLSIMMLEAGATRNAAGKAFVAVKALISAMVLINLDRLLALKREEEEKKWYEKKAYTVPTKSIKGISLDLFELGYKEIGAFADKALNLHDYQYNGLDPDFSPYKKREEAVRDAVVLIDAVVEKLPQWTGSYWDEEIKRGFEHLTKRLEDFKKRHAF
jgi:ribosomal protein S9